ncbi:Asp23/Gls24 family envelope stress response protein [Alicyclobacillus fastidiosus]|uniref:Asp23/Gls24 family envelope stress response protein n=1 Tax=Alicyclobacillus fastidiosus TaxID=392011 RepID=A0ABV5AIP7_9BACL|nr:Asp23/Gls24 family envelope stress response protein [Alicyclobacillus fastidiosus]WEH08076.1 Asp23/Gls24 family envelope stress response protein [Alicyclobacillus fastidiosus]
MPKTIDTQYGQISVADEVIATSAGFAAMECEGLASMASRRQVVDRLTEVFGRDNPGRGVEVRFADGSLHVDLYIVVNYGVNIYETAQTIRQKVHYLLSDTIGVEAESINIYVQGVKF